jgi:lysine 2,3-aminomutase
MNGSADCEQRSSLATDEEPPGPLDLSSSILPNGLRFDAGASVASSPGFGPAIADSYAPVATIDEPTIAEPASGSLAFLRATTSVATREFRLRHFADVPNSEWNDWRWQSRHRIRTLTQLEQMLTLSEEEREALVQGGTMLPVGI